MIDLDLASLSSMMSDILNRKNVDMEKFERLKTKMYSKLSMENGCKEDMPRPSIDKTSLKDEKINHNEDNFIAIEGICRECGYPVICEDDYCMSNNAGFDFHVYCSNPRCTHHKGYEVNDTDIDDDQLPFIEFSKEALIKDNILK